jgi:hypothetical protein
MHPDRLIAEPLVGLAVGGEKPAGRLPPLAPLRLGESSRLQVLAGVEQPPPAADDTDPTLRDARLDTREPASEEIQAALFLPAFGAVGVAAHPPGPTADLGGQPRPQVAYGPLETAPLVQQVPVAALPLVVAGAGNCPRPAAGRGSRQRPLPAGPVDVFAAETAALGQVMAGQPPEILTNLAQHHPVDGRDPQPGTDADTRWECNHERLTEGAQPRGH